MALLAVWLTGCDFSTSRDSVPLVSNESSIESPAKAISQNRSIDLGVIFYDEASYVCFPFDRVGLIARDEITKLKTSCECVRASVVEYRRPNSSDGKAIRLDLVPENPSKPAEDPINLGVIVYFELATGERKSFTAKLLQTQTVVAGKAGNWS